MRGRLAQLLAPVRQSSCTNERIAAELGLCSSAPWVLAQWRHAGSDASGGGGSKQQQQAPKAAQKKQQSGKQQQAAAASKPSGKAAGQQAAAKAQADAPAEAAAIDSARLAGLPVSRLLDVGENLYFDVPQGVLPEATSEYYADPILKGDGVHEPNFGCKGVQREWEWSGRRSLMARPCMRDLALRVQAGRSGRLYLNGWAGSGKSVALYSLVAWARANGYVALYLPSAFSLVQSGTFSQAEDGLWDTPEAARWVLSSLRDAHADALPALRTPAGQPLSEAVEAGLDAAAKPPAVVAAAVAAKEALAAATEVRTLVAVDDYNVLYSHTGYYESVHNFHRRQLAPDELRLVQAFRVLEQPPPANGFAVAAPSLGAHVSPRLRVPRPRGSRHAVPRYNAGEVAAAAEYFIDAVMQEGETPGEEAVLRALLLTNGNAAELRRYAPALLLGHDMLGLSRGYKAEAAARRAYEQGDALLGDA